MFFFSICTPTNPNPNSDTPIRTLPRQRRAALVRRRQLMLRGLQRPRGQLHLRAQLLTLRLARAQGGLEPRRLRAPRLSVLLILFWCCVVV